MTTTGLEPPVPPGPRELASVWTPSPRELASVDQAPLADVAAQAGLPHVAGPLQSAARRLVEPPPDDLRADLRAVLSKLEQLFHRCKQAVAFAENDGLRSTRLPTRPTDEVRRLLGCGQELARAAVLRVRELERVEAPDDGADDKDRGPS